MSNRLSRRAVRGACIAFLGFFASVAAQAAGDADPVQALVDATIRPLMARHDIPGMAVAVTMAGRAQVFNYGVASKASGIPVSDATSVAMKDGFVAAMQTQLLPRLGMRRTHIRIPADAMADYVWGYRGDRPVHASPGPFDAETVP